MRRRRTGTGHGTIYRPQGRDGQPTQWYWLLYRLPGDAKRTREPTNPRTDDEAEARRQLHVRMGERGGARRRRQQVEDLLVADLLGLYVAECDDHGQPVPPGHVEAWMTELGGERAIEVERDMLDAICRRWRKAGVRWTKGHLDRVDAEPLTWEARDPKRVRPLSGASINRYLATLRRAYQLGKEKRQLVTALTFPHYEESARGEYLTEDQCRTICENFHSKRGATVKADVFRLAYLLGIRKGQLRRTLTRHVVIEKTKVAGKGVPRKLRWSGEETKNGEAHEVVLLGEAQEIVQRAWANRLPDCDYLFHVNGQPLGPMRSELRRTCQKLGIPYGRGKGIVFHDTRHSAVTNLVAAGTPEPVAMTITGHADPNVFKRYNVRRDDVQADALARQQAYLDAQRGTSSSVERIGRR